MIKIPNQDVGPALITDILNRNKNKDVDRPGNLAESITVE